jgi:hypothetical protein
MPLHEVHLVKSGAVKFYDAQPQEFILHKFCADLIAAGSQKYASGQRDD